MGRKYKITTEYGVAHCDANEIRRSCTSFQFEIWSRTRNSTMGNKLEFLCSPTDFPKVLPPFCPVIGQRFDSIKDVIVVRLDHRMPHMAGNIELVSRTAFNALNAGLTFDQIDSLYKWAKKNKKNLTK